jgi:glycosyltransferase involved in cell wall biosynthesis
MNLDKTYESSSTPLFDSEWYCRNAPALALNSDEAFSHYLTIGWAEGRDPCPFFDTAWYLATNLDVVLAGVNPLRHYISCGEAEGRWPCRIFDPRWYSQEYGVKLGGGNALTHYLTTGCKDGLKPNEIFDPIFYKLSHRDLQLADVDASIHYLSQGYRENRHVAPGFSLETYRNNCFGGEKSIDPVYHCLTSSKSGGVGRFSQSDAKPSIASEIRTFTRPGPDFEELAPDIIGSKEVRAKLIAFYLPQFHPIPENDAWWGTGFTEWRNTQRGVPRFVGHYQPRIPRDLGFYDLSNPNVLRRQIALARASGIYGFCFYYYNFNGKRILEKPVEQFLVEKSLEFPFCIMWANENWTRRWDGSEDEVLLWQTYKATDDEQLLADWSRHFSDPRYIKVGGRPLLLIYRAGIIPNTRDTVNRWRQKLKDNFGYDAWFLMAQTFGDADPREFGFDGACEFPPHKITNDLPMSNSELTILDPQFSGRIYTYEQAIERSLTEAPPDFPLIKTICPSWDNDARRQGAGMTLQGSSPAKYRDWLAKLVERARARPFVGEPFIFANAWNEWAESAYLEPDVYFGSAYLNATARALVDGGDGSARPRVLLVGHDALPYGAQLNLLSIGRVLTRRFGVEVIWLLLEGGSLLEKYQEIGPVIIGRAGSEEVREASAKLHADGVCYAITNTMVTGGVVSQLRRSGFRILSLVHEWPNLAAQYGLHEAAKVIARDSDIIVIAAETGEKKFREFAGDPQGSVHIQPQGLYAAIEEDPHCRDLVRRELGLSSDARIVLGIGAGDLRKGLDLFLSTARAVAAQDSAVQFVWAGRIDPTTRLSLLVEDPEDQVSRIPPNFHHVDFTNDIGRYLSSADVFFLSSREDPFPSVVLEALACGLPVVGFEGCSGTEDLIRKHGKLVPAFDLTAVAEAIKILLTQEQEDEAAARRDTVAREYRFDRYCFKLLTLLNPRWRPVSVIVPNYNYARYLHERMDSIFAQTVPVFEIIVLDDASSDDSLLVLDQIASDHKREFSVCQNRTNGGSAIAQWLKGLEQASGDLVWIAEADDVSEPNFLERLLAHFEGERTLFAYSDSAQIDSNGVRIGDSYHAYYEQAGAEGLLRGLVIEARSFAERFLGVRNLILNVSSILARREVFLNALRDNIDRMQDYSFAADWHLYASVCLQDGDVAYVAEPLNIHRRHRDSATHVVTGNAHIAEIEKVYAFLKSAYGSSGDLRALREQYIALLREQFGLVQSCP